MPSSLAQRSASSALNTTAPVAAPGDAFNPVAIAPAPSVSTRRLNSSSSRFASTRSIAVSSSIRPSVSMSLAITHSPNAVRLPTRVCRIHRRPFSIVNSMSHMSR